MLAAVPVGAGYDMLAAGLLAAAAAALWSITGRLEKERKKGLSGALGCIRYGAIGPFWARPPGAFALPKAMVYGTGICVVLLGVLLLPCLNGDHVAP